MSNEIIWDGEDGETDGWGGFMTQDDDGSTEEEELYSENNPIGRDS